MGHFTKHWKSQNIYNFYIRYMLWKTEVYGNVLSVKCISYPQTQSARWAIKITYASLSRDDKETRKDRKSSSFKDTQEIVTVGNLPTGQLIKFVEV